MINNRLKRHFQKRVEHRYTKVFKGYLRTLHELDTEKLVRLAEPYVPDSFEGEAVLSVGKSIDLVMRGASGVLNAMPFGCMPSTIVTALMRAVNRDYNLPFISVPYDGTESTTTRLQMEAFMDQARAKHEASNAQPASR